MCESADMIGFFILAPRFFPSLENLPGIFSTILDSGCSWPLTNRLTRSHRSERVFTREAECVAAQRFGHPVRMRVDVQRHRLEVAIAPLEGLPLAQTIAA